ncbi:MAG: TrmH family RNA methyltransferase [Acidimicrobiia bacterium]
MATPAARAEGRPPLGPKHAKVQRLRALLRESTARATETAVALEGTRAVLDALERSVELQAVFVPVDGAVPDGLPAGCTVERLAPGLIERVATTKTPQPILAVASRPVGVTPDAFAEGGCVLVLAGVSDPGNVGTLLRAAEASGVAGVVVGPGTADVFSPKVVRASAGSIFGVPIAVVDVLPDALTILAADGRRRYGTVATGGAPYTGTGVLAGPVALVLGNEAHGLPDDVRASIDELLTIPMAGAADSLNVAMAGSVLLFEAKRQRDAQ